MKTEKKYTSMQQQKNHISFCSIRPGQIYRIKKEYVCNWCVITIMILEKDAFNRSINVLVLHTKEPKQKYSNYWVGQIMGDIRVDAWMFMSESELVL